jgi:signal transduction histidine kinase
MRSVRADTGRLRSFFAFYASATDLDYGKLSMDRATIALPRGGAPGSVRWGWVLATGAGVGLISYLLLYPVIFGYVFLLSLLDREFGEYLEQYMLAYTAWVMPTMHMLLMIFAASWVARRVGAAAVVHGLLVALVSVVVYQGIVLYYAPPLNLGEAALFLVMALTGGLLGGLEGQSVLAGQETLYQASRSISVAREPRAALDAIYNYLAGSAVGGVALWQAPVRTEEDSSSGSGTLESWRSWCSQDWPDGMGFEGLDVSALVGADGRSLRALRVEDLSAHERAAWKSQGIRSIFLLPLVTPGNARVGLLAIASRRRRLPRSTVRACLTVGAQVALVLENLQLIEEAERSGRQAGVLRERQRMAQEIHDTLAQGFTSIVMNLEAAEGVLLPDSTQVRHYLAQARHTARESLTEARRLVWALQPEALKSASLPEALGRLVERWSEESGTVADVNVTGTPCPLSPKIETTLFRTAQEALANVRKHAHANRVALTLSYIGDTVVLDARDDGVGFDPLLIDTEKRDRTSGGFGLKGMRERVEQVGGSLSVESAFGEGSTLVVELPMTAANDVAIPEDESSEPLRLIKQAEHLP